MKGAVNHIDSVSAVHKYSKVSIKNTVIPSFLQPPSDMYWYAKKKTKKTTTIQRPTHTHTSK